MSKQKAYESQLDTILEEFKGVANQLLTSDEVEGIRENLKKRLLDNLQIALNDCFNEEKLKQYLEHIPEDTLLSREFKFESPLTPEGVTKCCQIVCEYAVTFLPSKTKKEVAKTIGDYRRQLHAALSILGKAQIYGNDWVFHFDDSRRHPSTEPPLIECKTLDDMLHRLNNLMEDKAIEDASLPEPEGNPRDHFTYANLNLINIEQFISDNEMQIVGNVIKKALKALEESASKDAGLSWSPKKLHGRPPDTLRNDCENALADLLQAAGLKQRQTAKYISGFMACCGLWDTSKGHESIEQRMLTRKNQPMN